MSIFVGIHISVCLLLIVVVLLQAGKGSSMGSLIGGSSQSILDGGSASNFLSKATTIAAIIFMITSLGMGYMQSKKPISIMDLGIDTSDFKENINVSSEEKSFVDRKSRKEKKINPLKAEKPLIDENKNSPINIDGVIEDQIK